MAQWRGGESCLETQPWMTISHDEKDYLIKGLFTKDSYKLLVTDFASVWQENLENKALLDRSKVRFISEQSLNPFVDVPLPVILQQLDVRLRSPQQCTFTIEIGEQFILSVDSPLQDARGPHYLWKFNCSVADSQILNTHLVSPLMSVTVELLRRQQELVNIIARKDREIKDYQDSGARVTRKHLQTATFDFETFNHEMVLSKEFEDSVNRPLKLIKSSDWNNLYKETTSYQHWQATKQGVGDNAEVTSTIPSSSQSKSSTRPTDSPEKQEKTRREALEKQIEESKAKGKRKKRKLM